MLDDYEFNTTEEFEFQTTFIGDGSSTEFQLCNIATEIISVKINESTTTSFTFDLENDTLIFDSAPSAGSIISVTYKENLSYAQGPATIATAEDEARDASGITKPNLHRRIDNELPGDTSLDFHEENFTGDGVHRVFTLENHTDIDKVVQVTVNNQDVEYTFNSSNNRVTLASTPADKSLVKIVYYLIIDNVSPDQYSLFVGGLNSFRGVEHFYYDENSTTSEIP